MKRTKRFILSTLAAVCLAGCTSDEALLMDASLTGLGFGANMAGKHQLAAAFNTTGVVANRHFDRTIAPDQNLHLYHHNAQGGGSYAQNDPYVQQQPQPVQQIPQQIGAISQYLVYNVFYPGEQRPYIKIESSVTVHNCKGRVLLISAEPERFNYSGFPAGYWEPVKDKNSQHATQQGNACLAAVLQPTYDSESKVIKAEGNVDNLLESLSNGENFRFRIKIIDFTTKPPQTIGELLTEEFIKP